ncbi:cytochrome P450 [Streptomyces olivaceus]|uniref:cytochrome P450 family protein n=1 Tax=Streptomyces TaxID=1883 RepID=UPI001CCC4576|nr:cytochrome P450 [Streptomyces olivaceus]MBZ6227628.1 cytochrome P450 [Streptomyces olivaceus]
MNGMPVWLVSRYDEVRECLSNPALSPPAAFAAEQGQATPLSGLFEDTVIGSNPPTHTRLRQPLTKVFNIRRVDQLRPRIQEVTDSLLDEVAADGSADLVPALAVPLPLLVICELLGVPTTDRELIHRNAQAMLASGFDPEAIAASQAAAAELWSYMADLTERKRRSPGNDLVSDLVAASDEERLSERELVAGCRALVIAGYELTSGFIGNALHSLLSRPEVAAGLRERPEIDLRGVDELLRHDGPGQFNVRFVNVDFALGGVDMHPGDQVLLDLEAANTDPSRYVDGKELDLTRDSAMHVQFGYGIHFCVGAPLARVEGEIAINTLFRRFPDIELAKPADEMGRNANPFQRSLSELPVRFSPRG